MPSLRGQPPGDAMHQVAVQLAALQDELQRFIEHTTRNLRHLRESYPFAGWQVSATLNEVVESMRGLLRNAQLREDQLGNLRTSGGLTTGSSTGTEEGRACAELLTSHAGVLAQQRGTCRSMYDHAMLLYDRFLQSYRIGGGAVGTRASTKVEENNNVGSM